MKKFNIIAVLNPEFDKVLMCYRTTNPYLGLYNFVGGKQETKESALQAAYRELYEETGIDSSKIHLTHMIDFSYPIDDIKMSFYAGRLKEMLPLKEEKHPLVWMPLTENFSDVSKFAGDGNIIHMVEYIKYYQMELTEL